MKKIILMVLCIGFSMQTKAQNSFGAISYPQTNAILSSGKASTSSLGGFLISSYMQLASVGTPNFTVHRLDVGGTVGAAPNFFQNDYFISNFDIGCPTSAAQTANTYGSSAIELNGVTGIGYAVYVSTDAGVVAMRLDPNGFIVPNAGASFPAGATTFVTKPVAVQYGGDAFFATSRNGILYVQTQVLSSGAFGTGLGYQITGASLIPTGILVEPYSGSDYITVVGYKTGGTSGQDGFFLQLDRTTFGLINYIEYDQTLGSNTDNTFQCITLDNSTTGGGPGFLVGGNSESLLGNPGKAWMLKLDPTGNVIWSSVIDGGTIAASGKIHAVLQRYSSTYARYENYGLCATNSGMTVYRLDDLGQPLSLIPGTFDEYVYNGGSSNASWPVDMSCNNTGASSDEGLHLFGNLNLTAGNPYFVQAYFSGESGCDVIVQINQVDNSTVSVNNITIGTATGLGSCPNITVTDAAWSTYSAVCGPFSFIPSGSNAKTSVGIAEINTKTSQIRVSPNPCNGVLNLRSKDESLANIRLIDLLGQTVFSIKPTNQPTEISIDLKPLLLKPGTYFLETTANSNTSTSKIIVTD